ncbi:NUDIX domain-containing protein [Pseudomonas sp. NPDC089534]|uniref:NUDIX domain-containing protein n=1 Tax=Pseudomonas sp. NPDC089534 TaxID=3364468 RepID=UPI0037FD1CBE
MDDETYDDPSQRWRVSGTKVVHENPWFSVIDHTVQLPDGRAIDYFGIHHERPAVGILARHEGRILLIRQQRFLIGQSVWGLPSGGVDARETPLQAAQRELLEETGYGARDWQPLIAFHPTYGCSDQRFEIFQATGVQRLSEHFDTHEVQQVRWFSISEIFRLIAAGRMTDGLSLVPILLHICQCATPVDDFAAGLSAFSQPPARMPL